VKNKLYKDLGNVTQKDTILASNTSSLPIATMANASGRPSKVVCLPNAYPYGVCLTNNR